MNSVDSADSKLAMSDVNKLLDDEGPRAEYPPPYEDMPSIARSPVEHPPSNLTRERPVYIQPPGAATGAVHMTMTNITPGMLGNQNVGPKRMNMFCSNCQSGIKTVTDTTHKCCTHCCCLFLFFTLILGPCCCLPYCCFSPEKVVHTCPNCKSHIGTYYG